MQTSRLIAVLLALSTTLAAAEKPLTLGDLGIAQPSGANTALQKDLETRSTMLQWHQWLGIAAILPMAGTYILGTQAQNDSATRDLHMALGVSTAALYFTSASFAIFAPKPDGIKDTGSTRWHRYLSYIHLPLMIAVPILGNMARSQAENGERTSGAASLHGPAASLLLGTYLVSVSVLVFNF
ncbi:MAG TPA: hypothetical protein PKM44_15855 [Turneriella sp.]|nr:hypothetical protein [Turneriella sp.]HNE21114.1 hypothetical protein [Turneriella sp.]HNJ66394.1 hypothetical protein [Turneriella sp.]HNL11986.1 hypothetical protein [Turneriella sp.]HNL55793.1 hypothetical protein [Turneriella sp.]